MRIPRQCNSPLRYPGGKAGFAPLLGDFLVANAVSETVFAEPYAGGAGAAINLLLSEAVSSIMLNDADLCIARFWRAVLNDTDHFLELLEETPVTIDEWLRQKDVIRNSDDESELAIGFATFFLNRTNRSGIMNGGPIGGREQQGNYAIDARFNKKTLAKRIRAIADRRHRIEFHELDALDFLEEHIAPKGRKAFVYLDPPYFQKGSCLYLNHYQPRDHSLVSECVLKQSDVRWVMSYDDSSAIRKIYDSCAIVEMELLHTARTTRKSKEILIIPPGMDLPATVRGASLDGASAPR